MHRARRSSLLVLLGLLLVTGGCLTGLPGFRSTGPEAAWEVAERYGSELRWGRLDEAALLVHPDLRPTFQSLVAGQADRLRITSFEVESVDLDADRLTGNALVRYQLYRLPAVVEESRRESLRLRRVGDGDWFVEPDLRALANDLGVDPDTLVP